MSKLHALDAELDRLTARAIETDKAIIDMLTANNAALRHEVVELRELVAYMHRCFVQGHDWGSWCTHETVFVEQRMRELGVEVDG